MTPNGVLSPSPPAKGWPPGRRWQDMQSPATTSAWPRRSWAAFGVVSGIGWERKVTGVSIPAPCRGSGGGAIWLTASPASPRSATAPPATRAALRHLKGPAIA